MLGQVSSARLGRVEAEPDPTPARARFEAGLAHRRAGALTAARGAFLEAALAARDAGDTDLFVRAALGAGGLWVYEQRDAIDRVRLAVLWEQAAAAAEPGSPLGSLLALRRAAEAVYEGGTIADAEAAFAAVVASGDDAAVAEGMSLLHHVLLDASHARRRLELAGELLRRAALLDDPLPALMGLCWRTVDLYLLGDGRARQSRVALAERSAAAGCEALAFIADVQAAMESARAGDLAGAEAAAGLALARGLAAGDPDAPGYFGAMLAALRWWQGRGAEVLDLVRSEATAPRLGGNADVYDAAAAMLSAATGDFDSAAESVQRLIARPLAEAPPSSARLTGLFLLGETAFLTGDEALAAEVAAEVEPLAALPVMPSLAVVCLGSARRTLGLAAATAGRFDDAVAHLDAAAAEDRRLGNRPMGLLTTHALAAVLRARAGDGDRRRAEDLEDHVAPRAQAAGVALPPPPAWLPGGATRSPTATTRGTGTEVGGAIGELRLRRRGTAWVLERDGGATVLPDLIGLAYLAVLLDNPGLDLPVLALAGASPIQPPPSGAGTDPVLDGPARRSYRRRMEVLAAAVDGDDSATDAADELRQLRAALGSATGLGGRWREFPTAHERARTAVRKALLRAIDAIESAEPTVGTHLRTTVRTGSRCSYRP